jgi:hypothetical protein
MMEAARTSETLVNFYQIHGATTQKTAIFEENTVYSSSRIPYVSGNALHSGKFSGKVNLLFINI